MRLSILDVRIPDSKLKLAVGDELIVVGRVVVAGASRELIDTTGMGATTIPEVTLGELTIELAVREAEVMHLDLASRLRAAGLVLEEEDCHECQS
jgi:hypothetical protein